MDYSDDETENSVSWQGVPGTVVLINIADPSKTTTPEVAHAATCLMTKQLLRLASSQNLGICLYGAEDINSSSFGINGVVDIFPLKVPTLQDLKKLRDIKLSNYIQAKELKLSDILWNANKMFANSNKTFSTKTIILLSRLDIPPVKHDHKLTLKRLDELLGINIEIRIINISEEASNIDSFYEEFLMVANKGKDFVLPKPIWDYKNIACLMYQETNRHLAVANLSFEIGNDMFIGVGVYRLLRKVFNKKVPLDRETNVVLTRVNKTSKVTIDQQNHEADVEMDGEDNVQQVPLLKTEVIKYQEYGGERIEFTVSEVNKLNNPFGPPMIKLLGFKPASILCKEKWYLKTGYFLFPNENVVEGSTIAFKALHQACIETGMVPLCVLCTRVNAKPNIVALVPCTQPLGLDVEVGFDVVHIPFVENKREVPNIDDDEERCNTFELDKTVMKGILNGLTFDYKHDLFENPKLQSEYRAIETIALKETVPFVDTTVRDSTVFKNIQADLFEEIFGPFNTTAVKRSTVVQNVSESKKMKADIDENLLQHHINNKTIPQNYNVPQLKQILKSKNITDLPALTGLKKHKLVDLVYKYFE